MAVDQADADDDVRAVLGTGAGKVLCGAGDVESFVAAAEPAHLHQLATEADAAVRALADLAKPCGRGRLQGRGGR